MLFMNCLTDYTTTAGDRKKIASPILSGFAYAKCMQLPWLYGLMTVNKYGAMSWPNRHASAMEITTSEPQRPGLLIWMAELCSAGLSALKIKQPLPYFIISFTCHCTSCYNFCGLYFNLSKKFQGTMSHFQSSVSQSYKYCRPRQAYTLFNN